MDDKSCSIVRACPIMESRKVVADCPPCPFCELERLEREEKRQELEEQRKASRYDFRTGCRDKAYRQPTLADQLRVSKMKTSKRRKQ